MTDETKAQIRRLVESAYENGFTAGQHNIPAAKPGTVDMMYEAIIGLIEKPPDLGVHVADEVEPQDIFGQH